MNPRHPAPAKGEQPPEEHKENKRKMGEDDKVSESSIEHWTGHHKRNGTSLTQEWLEPLKILTPE